MRISLVAALARGAGLVSFRAGALLSRLFSLFFGGTSCMCCGKPAVASPLCGDCIRKRILGFELQALSSCSVCGRPLLGEVGSCMACRRSGRFLAVDKSISLYPYRLWYKNLLFAWKTEGERTLSPIFARAVHKALCQLYAGRNVPCLVPVPPRPGKIRRTGWDQVDELCRLLSLMFGYRVERLLVRLSGEQQKKKDFGGRRAMKGIYGPSRQFTRMKRRDTMPREVILIDDLITSGSTVGECADILKRGFVEKVKVLSLFIVD